MTGRLCLSLLREASAAAWRGVFASMAQVYVRPHGAALPRPTALAELIQ